MYTGHTGENYYIENHYYYIENVPNVCISLNTTEGGKI